VVNSLVLAAFLVLWTVWFRCSDEGIGIKFRERCAKDLFSKCVHHLVVP